MKKAPSKLSEISVLFISYSGGLGRREECLIHIMMTQPILLKGILIYIVKIDRVE